MPKQEEQKSVSKKVKMRNVLHTYKGTSFVGFDISVIKYQFAVKNLIYLWHTGTLLIINISPCKCH